MKKTATQSVDTESKESSPPVRPMAPAAIRARLKEAQQLCTDRGTLLTPLRREVFQLLLARGGSAKAYDLHEDMRKIHGRIAPMTVYRALDFLMQMQLVHRVDSLNTFIACNHEEGSSHDPHDVLMLVCTTCGSIEEQQGPESAGGLKKSLSEQRGFNAQLIEVKGICKTCQAGSATSAANRQPEAAKARRSARAG